MSNNENICDSGDNNNQLKCRCRKVGTNSVDNSDKSTKKLIPNTFGNILIYSSLIFFDYQPLQKINFNFKIYKSLKWLQIAAVIVIIILIVLGMSYFVYNRLQSVGQAQVQPVELPTGRGLSPPNPEVPAPQSSSILQIFQKAAICSDSGVCSEIGRNIFHRGGNVVDATLATQFCNGIVTMQSLGIGGGFIMNLYNKTENRAYTIDAREVAPFAATEDMFNNKTALYGPLSIGVPGELMGYYEIHKRFATMTWKEIVEPSVKVCEDGFLLSKHMWDSLKINTLIKNDTHLSEMFVNKTTDDFYPVGTRVYPPKPLCNTYREIAEKGAFDFYNGELANKVAEDLEEIGSIVTLDDLTTYKADFLSSITVTLKDNTAHVVPPVGSGAIVGYILNILQGFNFTAESIADNNSTALTYHRIIEAFKYGYSKRSILGDMRFNNLREEISKITSIEFGEKNRKLIDDNLTFDDPNHYGAQFSTKDEFGTSHTSVIAPNGDAISVTSSINYYFGCGHTGRQTGIIFNSGMEDFSLPNRSNYFGLPPAKSNFITPQKRAMSSMAPTIITSTEGDVKLVVGAAGGSKIISAVALVIARVLWFEQDIKQAIDAPRFHHQMIPNELEYEFGVLEEIVRQLEEKGHKTKRYRHRGSAICGIAKNATAIYANADFRKLGDVSGF